MKKVYIVIGEESQVVNSREIFEVFSSKKEANKEIKKYKKTAIKCGYDIFWIEEWEVH